MAPDGSGHAMINYYTYDGTLSHMKRKKDGQCANPTPGQYAIQKTANKGGEVVCPLNFASSQIFLLMQRHVCLTTTLLFQTLYNIKCIDAMSKFILQ